MKKSTKITLISISLILTYYIMLCLCVSFKVNKILDESFKSYGEINTFSDNISDNLFSAMCYRNDEHMEYNDIYEENWHSFPITIVWLNNARSFYWYRYSSAFVKGYNIPVKIKLELKNFRWIITNVYESP